MKTLLPGLVALSLLAVACGAQPELKDWQFSKDGQQWEAVTVPHSYNAQDGPTQKYAAVCFVSMAVMLGMVKWLERVTQ